jgi:hypothetical protein
LTLSEHYSSPIAESDHRYAQDENEDTVHRTTAEHHTSSHPSIAVPYRSASRSELSRTSSLETGSDLVTTCPFIVYDCATRLSILALTESMNDIVGERPTPPRQDLSNQIGEFRDLCQDWATKGKVERNGEYLFGSDMKEELEMIKGDIYSSAEGLADKEEIDALEYALDSVIQSTHRCVSGTNTPAELKKTIFDMMARKISHHYDYKSTRYRKAIEYVSDSRKLDGTPFEVGLSGGKVKSRQVFSGPQASAFAAASCYRFQTELDEDQNSNPEHTRRRKELSKLAQVAYEITDHQYQSTQADSRANLNAFERESWKRKISMREQEYRSMMESYQSAL